MGGGGGGGSPRANITLTFIRSQRALQSSFYFHLLLLSHGFHCFDGCLILIIFHQRPTNLDLVPHSIPVTPWQLHFFSESAGCEWLFVTLGRVGSSTYGGCVLGCIRAENAVGWARDPSAGLPTPQRLEQQPSPLNHLNTSLCRLLFFWWG